jgi:hypothetical protein
MKLLGIINVGSNVIDQRLIKFSAFVRYWSKKWEYNETVHQLSEEYRLWVFESKVVRRIFGWKRNYMTGEWRKLHNKELHDFYSSPSIIRIMKSRRMRWVGFVGEKRNTYSSLVGKRPLGRPRRRWLDNIRMDLVEVG